MTTTFEEPLGHESFAVRNIHCGRCAETLRQTLASLPGVRWVEVDPRIGSTRINFDTSAVHGDELLEAVEAGGYEVVRAGG